MRMTAAEGALEKCMKLVIALLAAGLFAAPKVAAAVETKPLQLKPKAALVPAAPHNYAPFVMPTGEPDLDLIPRRDERAGESRSSCTSERSLCYDANSGRIVYKPARLLMPDIPGLQRENISVKRDRIVLRYSF
jgi:hypothetical protein